MAAQRSGPFSRRCGDRNRSWTQNNEEGKSRRRDRMTIDSKDSRVFFRKRIPSGKQSGKTKATRRYAESGIKEKRRRWGPRKTGGTRKSTVYRLPSPMSRASNKTEERRTLLRVPTESHSYRVASKSFYHPTELPRAFVASRNP